MSEARPVTADLPPPPPPPTPIRFKEQVPPVRALGRAIVAIEKMRGDLDVQKASAERSLERYAYDDSATREHIADLQQTQRWLHEILGHQIQQAEYERAKHEHAAAVASIEQQQRPRPHVVRDEEDGDSDPSPVVLASERHRKEPTH